MVAHWKGVRSRLCSSSAARKAAIASVRCVVSLSRSPSGLSAPAEIGLRRRPTERHPLTRPFLQRRAVGHDSLGEMRRAALPLTQLRERIAEIGLRRRPVERHPLAGPFLKGRAVGRDRLGEMAAATLPLPQLRERCAKVVLRHRPIERYAIARLSLQRRAVGRDRLG